MIAFDTNVLVRFLVEDDPEQSAAAGALVHAAVEADEKIYLSDVVLAEMVWVLERSYGFGRQDIVLCLRRLMLAGNIQVDSSQRLARCVEQYESGQAGLADYLILHHALEAGASPLYSFDKRLAVERRVEIPVL